MSRTILLALFLLAACQPELPPVVHLCSWCDRVIEAERYYVATETEEDGTGRWDFHHSCGEKAMAEIAEALSE